MPDTPPPAAPLPKSLAGYPMTAERQAQIQPHIDALAAAALTVSDTLPLQADGADFVATLEREGE